MKALHDRIIAFAMRHPDISWWSHAAVTVWSSLMAAAIVRAFLPVGWAHGAFAGGVLLIGGYYYGRKEARDTHKYQATGTYDAAQQPFTARMDRTGDLVGPWTAVATVLGMGALYLPWGAAFAMGLAGWIHFLLEARRAHRRDES